ncbi:MAG TPA: HEAT repeat domain-containing protein [Thermoguttaceae bacterium]|nr:HEAT repeat domain-containing protein [Thermoguttaceae bacterium]
MLSEHRDPTTIARLPALALCLLVGAAGTLDRAVAEAPRGALAKRQSQPTPLELSAETEARCVAILRQSLKSDEFWPSMHAAEALTLAGHGEEVRTALEPRLATETDDRQRCGLAREIVRAGDVSRVDVLLEVLAKDDAYGHVHAAESLYKVGQIGDGRLLRAAMAREESPPLQLMAAAALGRCGSPVAMQLVREKLADKDLDVSRIAAWVLARLGDESDVGPLRENLPRMETPLAVCFFECALAALGDAAGREALVRNLTAEDPGVRTFAATFAGELGMRAAADQLIKMLDDPAEDVRIRAAQSLLVLARPKRPDAGST